MARVTPLGAIARGVAAGVFGAFAQDRFFRLTKRLMPPSDPGVFQPPEEAQRNERPTETVARRFVEGFMRRGPLRPERKARAAALVHYAFAAEWGIAYALVRESVPWIASTPGTIAYSTAVWMVSDNILLPAFRLAAPPTANPLRTHLYAWAAHLAYGFPVRAAYQTLREGVPVSGVGLLAAGVLSRRPLRRRQGAAERVSAAVRSVAASVRPAA